MLKPATCECLLSYWLEFSTDNIYRGRKINSIIEPVGYTMSKRKIVKLDSVSGLTDSTKSVAVAKSATAKDKTPPKTVNKNATARKPLAKKVTVEKESSEEETSEEEVEDKEGTDEEDGDEDEEEHNSSEEDTD